MKNGSSAYSVTETLYDDDRTALCRALRRADQHRVLVKFLDPRTCRPADLERLRHDHEIGAALNLRAVLRPIALEMDRGMPVLLFEDFGGECLERLLGSPMPVERFLVLAEHIADGLAEIHGRGVVHRGLDPRNILVHHASLEVKITGFGLASRSRREQQASLPPHLIEGSLPYVSPEQTGRMNRAVDGRCDLYALGVIFYQMLTGRLPFEARDPLEWVHCHVARMPSHPSRWVPELPGAIADVVLKLLAKMPEDRYQSARGLRHDLDRCLDAWNSERRIPAFPLAERDVPDRLQIPQKLYGRQRELDALREELDRVVTTATPEIVLVAGHSGVGKTSLVHELRRPFLGKGGIFLSGKFDEQRQAAPYSPIVDACRELIASVLAEGDQQLGAWRQRLLNALGANGQLIVDLIPRLELVIGKQPAVPDIAVNQAQARFSGTFQRFFGALTADAGPIVLFLDDVQWADPGSLTLLQQIVTSPETRSLIVIAASRPGDGTSSRALLQTMDEVRAAGVAVREIAVAPLARPDMVTFVRDALHCSRVIAEPLANLVHDKTGGNPFFAIQFLTALDEDGLLEFDPVTSGWRWDVERIAAQSFTRNVVEFLVAKIGRLSEHAQAALELSACLGGTFALAPLAAVCARSEEDTNRALDEAVREGLVKVIPDGFQFLHDRIRQAAYARVPEAERAEIHLRIGRTLLGRTAAGEVAERVFDLVSQLNRGLPAMDSLSDREQLAGLDLLAARRARGSAAFRSAAEYCSAGLAALGPDPWSSRGDLAFALSLEGAECELGSRDLEKAERRLGPLQAHARTRAERAACRRIAIDLHTARGESVRALEVASECLELHGLSLGIHPAREQVDAAEHAMWERLGGRAVESLVDLPLAGDSDVEAAMGVLAGMLPSAYFVDVNLHRLIACTMVDLTLRQGVCAMSPMGLAAYGFERSIARRYAEADRFAQVALAIIDRHGFTACRSKVCNVCAASISVWNRELHAAIAVLREGVRAGVETGDQIFACLNHVQVPLLAAAAGDRLDEVDAEAQRSLEFVRSVGYEPLADVPFLLHRFVRALQGATDGDANFAGPDFDEAVFASRLTTHPLPLIGTWFHSFKLEAQVVAGDVAGALTSAAALRPLVVLVRGQHVEVDATFFSALALTAAWDGADDATREGWTEELRACDERLREWAGSCAQNFLHRSLLVGAEIARVQGRFEEAMRLYARATRSASEQGFVHVEALAHERAARCCRDRGFNESAEVHLREARSCYLRWGAHGKVRRLDAQFPHLAAYGSMRDGGPFPLASTGLDALAVAKAAQAISGEIVLGRLLEKLLRVVVEQAGAERGVLLLARPTGLMLGATAAVDGDSIAVEVRAPFVAPSGEEVPESVVQYVRRTREPVTVADAAEHEKFSSDPYVVRRRTKSMLCMPIVRQAELQGVLYLENDLVAGTFTPDRMAALTLLASQAAISMENAMLVAEERVARTAAEEAEGRSAFLAEAGALLSESLDYEGTLARLGRLCVQSLADWCVIDVVEDGEVRRVAGACADAANAPLLRQLEERYPPGRDSPQPAAIVLRSGEALLLPEMSDERLRGFCVDDDHVSLILALGARTLLAVPLVARGQTLAVITLCSATRPAGYGRRELELAQEVARRAAIAIDNARLYRATQTAVTMRDEFLAVASHELRTPMTSLVLSLQTLERSLRLDDALDQRATDRAMSRALLAGGRLSRLIQDLLEVSRTATGRLPLELDEVELGTIVREVAERFDPELARARCSLSIRGDAPVVGRWDASRLDQVVTNLLSNAVKFGAGQPIEIRYREQDRIAWLTVRDHGIGIASIEQARVFERFGRAVPSRHYGGLGLGLYIARSIVEAHGGKIAVSSAPGAGSTFTVELPCAGPARASTPGSRDDVRERFARPNL